MISRALAIALVAAGGGATRAAYAALAPAAPPAAGGQFTSMLLSMLVVLAVIGAVAWLVKRFAPRSYSGAGVLRVVAGTAVGQRERVVVVEIASTWLVLGVAPGQVNLLHQLPRAENAPAPAAAPVGPGTFVAKLKQLIEQRSER
jgi:flagellar protein FliO/FliZ